MSTIPDVRPSPIAGRWYSADPGALAREVDCYLSAARAPALLGEVIGLIAPHAGLPYSGPVAGYAFAAVQGQSFDRVVVLSPFHQYHSADFLTSAHQAYATPLGTIPIDREAVGQLDEQLRKTTNLGLTPVAFDPEHSLEMELPFLQRALSGPFQLLPVMIRTQHPVVVQAFGAALAEVCRDVRTLFVASTDLSHFYPQSEAQELDTAALEQMAAYSPDGLFQAAADGRAHACGLSAVAAALVATRALGGQRVQVLRYATSGDVTGDRSSVVGYGAAAILK